MHAAWITQDLCNSLNVPVMYCPAKGDTSAKDVTKWLEKKVNYIYLFNYIIIKTIYIKILINIIYLEIS